VVNLAGAGIADQRWSDARKEELHNSRVTATRHIVDAIRSLDNPPSLINASAVGGYGPRGNTPVDESSQTGAGYLAEVCRAWEAEADRAVGSTRVVKVRIGLALSTEGGALAKMFLPFRLGLGGPIGSGSQGMPWIHIDDLTNILQLAIDNTDCTGVINAVAPNPVNNKTFTRTLGRVLHRPAILPAPAIALKLLLGEMAEALLLEGQFVLPTRVLDLGYAFQYPELEPALRDLLSV